MPRSQAAPIAEAVAAAMPKPRKRTKEARAAAKALASSAAAPLPAAEHDPRRELRRLCKEHHAWTKRKVALVNMAKDKVRKVKSTEIAAFELPGGDRVAFADVAVGTEVLWGPGRATVTGRDSKGVELHVPCILPKSVIAMLTHSEGQDGAQDPGGVVEGLDRQIDVLEKQIRRLVAEIPIFKSWLSKVYGFQEGGVVAGYLLSFVDVIHGGRDGRAVGAGELRAAADPALTSAGQIVRYCGWACIGGRLERPSRGKKLAYNAELRKRLWQWMNSLIKNMAQFGKPTRCDAHAAEEAEAPKPKTKADKQAARTKAAQLPRCAACLATSAPLGYSCKYLDVFDATVAAGLAEERTDIPPEARAMLPYRKGYARAISLFLEDYYLVARASAGLPVSPTRYARALGYAHAGEVRSKGPVSLSLDEALKLVGVVGKYQKTAPSKP